MRTKFFVEPYYVPSETEVLRLYGSFLAFGLEQKAWVHLSHKLFEPSEIECHLFFPGQWRESHRIPDLQDRNLEIKIEAPFRGSLRLQMISSGTYTYTDARFEVAGYDLLPSEVEISEGARVTTSVDLTKSRLIGTRANRLLKLDGTIERIGEDLADIAWNLDEVYYKFTRRTAFERVTAGQDDGYIMRARPCLTRSFSISERTDLSRILDRTEKDIEDVLRLFSFLSRERVEWFEILIGAESQVTGKGLVCEGKRRTQIWAQKPADRHEDPLLKMHELLEGGF